MLTAAIIIVGLVYIAGSGAQYSTLSYNQPQYTTTQLYSSNAQQQQQQLQQQQTMCYSGTNGRYQTAVCPYNYCFKSVTKRGSEETIQKTCGGTMCQGLETLNIENGRGYCCQGNLCNAGVATTVSMVLFVFGISLFIVT